MPDANEHLTSLAFDLFQRYRLLRIAGPFFGRPDSRLRLLDVGGNTPVLWKGFRSLSRELVPDSFSVVADIAPGAGLTDYVRASTLQLPFPDESFDLVSSFDLLEHVRCEDRLPALREMLRVTRDGLLVAFPFDSPVNRTAEKMLADYLKLHFHGSIPMLDEHSEFGLPDRAGVERFFAASGHPSASFDCGNTDVWLLMMMTQHSLHRSGCELLVKNLNRRFNLGPVEDDWSGPAYRAYFLLSKRSTSAALDAFRSMPDRTRTPVSVDAMLPVCRLLLDIATRGRALAGVDGRFPEPDVVQEPGSHAELRAEVEKLRRLVGAALIDIERDRFLAEKVVSRTENLARRLDEHGRQVTQAFRTLGRRVDDHALQISSILHSRIWQTLCKMGALALRFANGKEQTNGCPALTCEEPAAGDLKPRTGTIVVRGWIWPPSSAEAVHVQVGDLPAEQALVGLPSPEAALAFPGAPDTGKAGFRCDLDTLALPEGVHTIRIRATGRNGAAPEIQTEIRVEHGNGFASDYDRWIAECEGGVPEPDTQKFQPLVSIVLPVSGPSPAGVERSVRSVRAQVYGNWELCIAAARPQPPEIERLLNEQCDEEVRIRVARVEPGTGPSATANAALAVAGGDYVALLEDTAELSAGALLRIVGALNLRSGADVLYSDEDTIDESGRRIEPFFKPDWSPDLLLSQNYIGGLLVARTALVRSAGGFRSEFDGSENYDLALRLTRQAGEIVHVPAVLYHCSVRRVPDADAARRAIEDHLRHEAIDARVEPGAAPGNWRVRYAIPHNARVSILIPSGGKLDVLRANLEALFAKTDYHDYEIVVIDNSRGNVVHQYVEGWNRDGKRLRWLDMRNWPFNYAALNNEAARHCDAPFLLFLNDDTEAIAPGWLTAMVELGARPEVGAVGSKLLYPSGLIQHAGVVMGLFGGCAHAFRSLDGSARHYFDLPDVIRNVSAVTGACLLVPANVFRETGGFDESLFPVAFNDIDLCLKIGARGYRVLYTPHALLYHRESYSKTLRDMDSHPGEILAMKDNWKDIIAADPFYSPHLTRTAENYSLRREY